MSSRDKILSVLDGSEGKKPAAPPTALRPEYRLDGSDLHALFIQQAEKQQAQTLRVDMAADAPALLKRRWQIEGAPCPVHITPASPLEKLPWQQAGFEILPYTKASEMQNSASLALAAIAETGTLAVRSSVTNARGINFFVDNHILFVSAKDFFLLFEDFWSERLAEAQSIHLITGPSRTADIEQELYLGAQGPKSLWIVIYKNFGG